VDIKVKTNAIFLFEHKLFFISITHVDEIIRYTHVDPQTCLEVYFEDGKTPPHQVD